jgi:hypothetical protein
MEEITSARGLISTINPFSMFEAYQKVFFANITAFYVADFKNWHFPIATIEAGGSATIPIFGTIIGKASGTSVVDPTFIVDFCTNATGTADLYAYQITAGTIDSSTEKLQDITNNVIITASADGSTHPHFYEWKTYANITADYGVMPSKATLACLYRGRNVLSGNKNLPHQWYMSRQANPWDFMYIANDAQSPVAGGNSEAGELGDIITALIPFKDDYLIFGCANSIWVLRGDPAYGGSLDKIEDNTGIFGSRSWCWGPNNTMYFIGLNGLYTMTVPGFDIKLISALHLPNLVKDWQLDPSVHRVTMGYDRIRDGILIARSLLDGGANDVYWYDLKTEGFFPESYPDICGPFAMHYYEAEDDDYRHLLMGCTDGYIRYFLDTAKDDDSGATDAAISSYVVFPMQSLSEDADASGRLQSMTVIVAGGGAATTYANSDQLQIDIHKGNSAEAVLEAIISGATAHVSALVTAIGRTKFRPRTKGNIIGVKCHSVASSESWTIEKIVATVKGAGRIQ